MSRCKRCADLCDSLVLPLLDVQYSRLKLYLYSSSGCIVYQAQAVCPPVNCGRIDGVPTIYKGGVDLRDGNH